MIRLTIAALSLSLLAFASRAADTPAAAPNASTLGPQELVENSAKRMLQELDANRAMYAKDPAKLDALVANVLLPNFDSEYAARLVLGQNWRTANEEQRIPKFITRWRHSRSSDAKRPEVPFTRSTAIIAFIS